MNAPSARNPDKRAYRRLALLFLGTNKTLPRKPRPTRLLFMLTAFFLPLACRALAAGEIAPGDPFADRAPIAPFKQWFDVRIPPPSEYKPGPPETFTLSNGATVFLLPDRALPLVTLLIRVKAGERAAPAEKAGLARITAETMLRGGGQERPGTLWTRENADVGAVAGLSADHDAAAGGLTTLKEDFPRLATALAAVIRNPAFPPDALETALAEVRLAVAGRAEHPFETAREELLKAAYGNDASRLRPITYETLARIRRADVVEFHRRFWRCDRMFLGLTGDFDAPSAKDLLEKIFGQKGAETDANATEEVSSPPPFRRKQIVIADLPDRRQTAVLLGHLVDLNRASPDYPAVLVMNEILSGGGKGRLNAELTQKRRWAAAVRGRLEAPLDGPGLFTCATTTGPDQAAAAANVILAEIRRLREEGVTESETQTARETLRQAFIFNDDTPEKRLSRALDHAVFKAAPDLPERTYKALASVTADDVRRVARVYLDPERPAAVFVGDARRLRDDGDLLKDAVRADAALPPPPQIPLLLDPDREEQGKKLLDQMLAACGGKTAFAAIRSLHLDLRLHVAGLKLDGALRLIPPGRIRADVAGPFGPISQIISGEKAWRAMGSRVQAVPREEAVDNLRALLLTDFGILSLLAGGWEGVNVQTITPLLEPSSESGGALCSFPGVVLESQSLGRIRLYLDEKTKRPVLLKYRLQSGEGEKRFLKPRAFGTLTTASWITDRNPMLSISVEILNIRFNSELADDLFLEPRKAEPPPPFAAETTPAQTPAP
jgi:zinc protease